MKKISLFFLICAMTLIGATKLQAQNVCTVYDDFGTELISYDNLGSAFNFAVNNPDLTMHIVMTKDYTLPEGNYTLPANASLLIPHKADQKKPYGEDPWRIMEMETPQVFRTLTFADGVNIVVKGMLEISSQQFVASASENGTGRVAGAYGVLSVADGCNVWLDNGSKLCAWGYMKGNGNVQAKRGATVYEMFQTYDWKGGTNISKHFLENHNGVFPFNQYFIQNIEMPVTYQPGSQLLTAFGITIYSKIYAVNNIGIIGTHGSKIKSMFEMDNDADYAGVWVRKSYNPTEDRQVYEINNAAYINAMTIEVMGYTFSSNEYQLPITHNMDIHLKSGLMRITQDVVMLPGSQIEIDKESTVQIDPNKSVYLYDVDQWDKYAYSNQYAKMVWYSPSWTNGCPRDENNNGTIDKEELADASINVHGTLEMHGNIFTTTDANQTAGGANIYSTNADAGTIQFADEYTVPAVSMVYQWKQTVFPDGMFYGATAPSAWLKNGDETFVKTSALENPAGQSLCYINNAWSKMTTIDCFVYDEANEKWYIKPAEYVQIKANEEDPIENADHLYTDITETRLFLQDIEKCQWWEVVPETKGEKIYYYCAKNGLYYEYVGIWQEAKVKVNFDPANGQSSVDYNVKLGTVPQYMGDDPVKEQDQAGSYTFLGWSSDEGANIYKFNPMPAVWNPITYIAQYFTILRKYLITFANANDGANVGKEYQYNETPSYEDTPTKVNDNLAHDYQFTGWKGEDGTDYATDAVLPAVTGRATYTAQFEGTPYTYTITWLKDNGDLFTKQENVQAGSNIIVPEYTETIPDSYTFAGWRNLATNIVKDATGLGQDIVTGDATYQAVLAKEGCYRISFVGEDGTVYSTQYVEPNTEFTYVGRPTESGKEFIGWSPTFYTRAIATEDNMVYVAHFREASEHVAKVTINNVTTLYANFEDAFKAACDATGDVTLTLLKSTEFKHTAGKTIQANTNFTFDFNGCEINLTGSSYPFLRISKTNTNSTVIIRDSSPYNGGIARTSTSFLGFDTSVSSASQITMESGAIITTVSACFGLYGEGTSFTMNGGYVEVNATSSSAINLCNIVGKKQKVEFNGGKWYINNTGTGATYAMQCGSSCDSFDFTMNGGEIELKGKAATYIYYSTVTPVHIEINDGRLSASSTGGNVTIFSIPNDGASTIYINNGEFSAVTTYSSGTAQMTYNIFTGQVIGGKFKVSALKEANQYYFYNVPSVGLKGGLYNIYDPKVANGLTDRFVLKTLTEADSEYANGYRYQAVKGSPVMWKTGEVLLQKAGAKEGELLVPFKPDGQSVTWYKDKACTPGQEWNFATETMPSDTLYLYTILNEWDVIVSMEGETDVKCSFSQAWAATSSNPKPCTITLQNDASHTADILSIAQDVTLDLNGKVLTVTGSQKLVTIPSGKTLTIKDNIGTGEIIGATTLFSISGKVVMNGGYCHRNSTGILCELSGGEIEFNDGKWYAYTSNSGNAITNNANGAKLTMNGGTIQADNTSTYYIQAISSSSNTMTVNMTGGTISSTSSGNGAGYVFNLSSSSTINISGGEIIGYAKGKAASGKIYITKNPFKGSITGGKFKFEKSGSYGAVLAFSENGLDANTISGGYFDRYHEVVNTALAPNCAQKILTNSDPEYANGYRYKVISNAHFVNWNTGDITIMQSGEQAGEKLTKYEPEPNMHWYKDKAMTNEWNFSTDVMPNNDLTLYGAVDAEAQLIMGGSISNTYFDAALSTFLSGNQEGTIKLLKPITIGGDVKNLTNDLTLDLNGKKLTFTGVKLFSIKANKTFTIKDSSPEQNGELYTTSVTNPLFDIYGNFVMNGGKCTIAASSSSTPKFSTSYGSGSITINGGTISVKNTNGGVWAINASSSSTPSFTMTGGKFEVRATASGKAAYVFYSVLYAWTVNISGGIIDSEGGGYSNFFNMKNTSNINISGGEFISKATSFQAYIFHDAFNGTISGGKFKSLASSSTNQVVFSTNNASFKVDGGIFNTNNAKVITQVNTYSGHELKALPAGHPALAEGYTHYVSNPEVTNKTISDNEVLAESTTVSGTLTITKTGKLTVPTGKAITTKDFILQSAPGKSGQVIGVENLTVNGNAYFEVKLIDAEALVEDWYAFTVPFDVDSREGVYRANGNKMTFGVDYDLFGYDGAARAANGSNGWKRVSGDLKAGTAYLIGVNEGENSTIRFKKKADAAFNTMGDITLQAHASEVDGQSNWNGVGNNLLQHIAIDKAVQVYENSAIQESHTPKFNVYAATDYNFIVGTPFFIQGTGTLAVTAADGSTPLRAPKYDNDEYQFCVQISKDEAAHFDNQIYVRASEGALSEFEEGHDMVSFNGTTHPSSALLWTNNYNCRLAIESAPLMNDQALYNLGISIPTTGIYTLHVQNPNEEANLYLLQEGQPVWNLTESDYTLDLDKGVYQDYDLLLVTKAPMTPTGIANGHDKKVNVQKVLINGNFYILLNGRTFDAQGKLIRK